jgi:hypothetical protein
MELTALTACLSLLMLTAFPVLAADENEPQLQLSGDSVTVNFTSTTTTPTPADGSQRRPATTEGSPASVAAAAPASVVSANTSDANNTELHALSSSTTTAASWTQLEQPTSSLLENGNVTEPKWTSEFPSVSAYSDPGRSEVTEGDKLQPHWNVTSITAEENGLTAERKSRDTSHMNTFATKRF